MKEQKIQWHPAFAAAVNLELAANRNDLVFEREFNLNTKPLEIDLLVIKKNSHVQITNEIGRLFGKYNLLEYKSPEDHLNIDTFYKCSAYASLYKSYGQTVNERKAQDITVSLIREARPTGLFHYFEESRIRVLNPYPGIYYVLDEVLFSTQIIVTKELDSNGHTWLKSLSDCLKKQEMQRLFEEIDSLTQEFDRELASAVLEVSVRANQQILEEFIGGEEALCPALYEIMAPKIEKIAEQKAIQLAEQKVVELMQQKAMQLEEQKAAQLAEQKALELVEQKAAQLAEQKALELAEQKAAQLAEQKATQLVQQIIEKEFLQIASAMLQSGKFSASEIKKCIPGLSLDAICELEKDLIPG